MTNSDSKSTLLLLSDVEDLGRKGQVVSVKKGFARNYLLPKRKAVLADANALRIQERLQKEREEKAAQDLIEAKELKVKLDKLSLRIDVKVDPEGHMYGSVSAGDITELLSKSGHTIEKKSIVNKAIKTTGRHTVEVKLKEDVEASFTLDIIPEGITEEELQQIIAPIQEQNDDKASQEEASSKKESKSEDKQD